VSATLKAYGRRRFDKNSGVGGGGWWKCRQCHEVVTERRIGHSLYNLATCAGVVPLVRDLEEISRTTLSALTHPPNAAAATAPSAQSPPAPRQLDGRAVGTPDDGQVQAAVGVRLSEFGTSVLSPSGGSRGSSVIGEIARFVAATFAPAGPGSGAAVACRICDERFSPAATGRWMLRHSLGRYCLSRRVERELAAAGAAARSDLARACTAARCSQVVTRSLDEYRLRNFLPQGIAPPSLRSWMCRHCRETVCEGRWKLDKCLNHLAGCVGAGSVVGATGDIVRENVLSRLAEARCGSTRPSPRLGAP
jgi:hypothetical protein